MNAADQADLRQWTSLPATFQVARLRLPAGKYTVTAWQEQYGTQTQDVTIAGNESKSINFVFKAIPYKRSHFGFDLSRGSLNPG